jgi:hypothetical protein
MTLAELSGKELEWNQPGVMRRIFHLTAEGRQIASLRFESSFGSVATGECGDAKWSFKRGGFMAPKISVRTGEPEAEVAVYSGNLMGGGWVVFNAGGRYHLRHVDLWRTEWTFETAEGRVLVTLSRRSQILKEASIAKVTASGASLPETPILLLLMWYVRILMSEDAGAASAAT